VVILYLDRPKPNGDNSPLPFLLPRSFNEDSESAALVLAFGKLSALEACAMLRGSVDGLELPSERILTLRMQPSIPKAVPGLAGIHKFVLLLAQADTNGHGVETLVERIAARVDEISNFSVSAYGIVSDDYEEFVQLLLSAFRSGGFKKIHLIRSDEQELRADQVAARNSLDIVVFPHHGHFSLGLTSFVTDSTPLRNRGKEKPVPRSEISMSPRLAKVLVNLSGVGPGQTLLDPFCGSGTILGEGLLKSLHCIGIDSWRRTIDEARQNLQWISSGRPDRSQFRLIVGDARDTRGLLGDKAMVDGVATEPILLPKLRGQPNFDVMKEAIAGAGDVYADALDSVVRVVRPGGRIVVTVPVVQTTDGTEIFVGLDGRPLGLKLFQPGPVQFHYPIKLSFESTRWVKRAVYVFETEAL
jgi:tRNA G10  N-methylase Trm11